MARGKAAGAATKPKQQPKAEKASKGPRPAKEAKSGDNSQPDDQQMMALLYSHDRIIAKLEQAAHEAKKALDKGKADLRADGFAMADLKDIRSLRTDSGMRAAKADMERKIRNLRWGGMAIGSQGNLFEEDRTPVEDRTLEDGRRAALEGADCKPPNGVPHHLTNKWIEGWHAGQATQRANLERMMKRPRAEPISDEEFSRQEPAGSA